MALLFGAGIFFSAETEILPALAEASAQAKISKSEFEPFIRIDRVIDHSWPSPKKVDEFINFLICQEKAKRTIQFGRYVEENSAEGYQISWSEWISAR